MRKILRLFIILFIFGLVWNFIESPVYAKSYSITSDQFIINILADKSVLVKEELTYSFSGSFSWADMYIPTQDTRKGNLYNTQISDFQVTASDGSVVSILDIIFPICFSDI